MSIDVNSIKPIKYKNEDAVLRNLLAGQSVRGSAVLGGVSSKTAHKIRQKHADKFPEKEKVFRTPKLPRVKNVKRWLTVPKDVDEKIVMKAMRKNMKWQDFVNEILEGEV